MTQEKKHKCFTNDLKSMNIYLNKRTIKTLLILYQVSKVCIKTSLICKDIVKIKGYVAMDKDGSIWFHYTKPHRENDIEKTWRGSNDKSFEIYDFDFLEYTDLTWEESEPVEVELTLKRLNAGG